MNFTLLRFDEIGSTNTEALNQARRGAPEGVSVVARRQTAGRGRYGRVWVSEKDAGLYLSIVLRPKIDIKYLPLITLMTAVAVHDTLEELYEIDCDIKWVNDIHVDGRKICGILAETTETKTGLAVIVGIGINLKSSNFPPDLAKIVTSIEAETNKTPDPESLLPAVTRFFADFCDILYGTDGAEKIRREWSRRSSYSDGKKVRIVIENETIYGTTRGIEENGALRVASENGEIRIIHAGDVEQLRVN